MFTGIIEEIGKVKGIRANVHSLVLEIECHAILEDMHLGDSISVNGVCLTVTHFGKDYFVADVMHETLNRSSLATLSQGKWVNLERAMSMHGRFGGHIVSGHIDGTGTICQIKKDDNATWYTIACDRLLLKYIVEKGSIAIDGISLTVAKVNDKNFQVSIIPHTGKSTTLSQRNIGDKVNLENDCIGKYVERLMHFEEKEEKVSSIDKNFLLRNGFL